MSYVALRFDADGRRRRRAGRDALLDAGALSVDVADPRRRAPPHETPLYGEPGDAAGALLAGQPR